MNSQSNPPLYRRLSVPFASQAEAQEQYDAFIKEVGEIREKHRIREVLIVAQFGAITGSGEEGETIALHGFGHPNYSESMAAYAFGQLQKGNKDRIGQLVKGNLD